MVQQITDNFWQAEARSEETKQFICEGMLFAPMLVLSDRYGFNTCNGTFAKVRNSTPTCTYDNR